jgi:hypothetical protein
MTLENNKFTDLNIRHEQNGLIGLLLFYLIYQNRLQKVYLKYMEHVTIRNFNFKPVDAFYDKRMNEMEAVIMEMKNKIELKMSLRYFFS